MKKLSACLLVSTFFLGSLAFSGCGDPCEKAFKKYRECAYNQLKELGGEELAKEGIEEIDKAKDEFLKECKKHKDKIKDCVKIDDCKKFEECVEKAVPDDD